MSKKNKEVSKLRREVEFLKSQLKNREGDQDFFKIKQGTPKSTNLGSEKAINLSISSNTPEVVLESINPYLKRDLIKSASLTVFSFTVIFLMAAFSDKTSFLYNLPALLRKALQAGLASPLLSRFGF